MLLYIMSQRSIIQLVPNIHEYIFLYSGPWSERVDDYKELEELVDTIVEENTQQEVDLEDKGELVLEPLPLVSHNEALQAMYVLKRFEEGYQYLDGALLKALRRFERDLAERY
jgi:hypothetical protein